MASFVQDDFKVNTRLTFNLGVRWEINTGVSEAFGNMSGLATALIRSSPPPTAAGTFAGSWCPPIIRINCRMALLVWGTTRSAGTATPLHNVGPRFGFAWQPLSKSSSLVVRGGWGVFYSVPNGNSVLQTLGGYPFRLARVSDRDFGMRQRRFQVPFTVPLTPGVWTPRTPTSQLSETLVAANYDSPMTQQFSLDLQGQVLPSTVLELAYGRHSGYAALGIARAEMKRF